MYRINEKRRKNNSNAKCADVMSTTLNIKSISSIIYVHIFCGAIHIYSHYINQHRSVHRPK